MIRSINTVNKSMNVLQKRQENTGANIANTNTPGYKFQDIIQTTSKSYNMINHKGENSNKLDLGNWTFGAQLDGLLQNFEEGPLMETGDPMDFAILGGGFFTLALNDGTRAYTRNGNFIVDEENKLVTMEGNEVLGLGLDGNPRPLYLNQDGNIIDNLNLLITGFEDTTSLKSLGQTLFTSPNNEGFRLDSNTRKGYLEMSNVVIADEMVKLIEIAREFEANQKLLHTSDETLNKAVNEIGRV